MEIWNVFICIINIVLIPLTLYTILRIYLGRIYDKIAQLEKDMSYMEEDLYRVREKIPKPSEYADYSSILEMKRDLEGFKGCVHRDIWKFKDDTEETINDKDFDFRILKYRVKALEDKLEDEEIITSGVVPKLGGDND